MNTSEKGDQKNAGPVPELTVTLSQTETGWFFPEPATMETGKIKTCSACPLELRRYKFKNVSFGICHP